MEEAATISDHGTLSVDDLVMKIGLLTVELMQKEREAALAEQKTRAAIASLATEGSQAKSEVEALRAQLQQAESYKASHDALSVRYNQLSQAMDEMKRRLNEATARATEAEARVQHLEEQYKQALTTIEELQAKQRKSTRKYAEKA